MSPRSAWSQAIVFCTGLAALAGLQACKPEPPKQAHHHGSKLQALDRTLLPLTKRQALQLPALRAADGAAFGPARLQGRWSLVFFGYTSCPDVCPTTLQTLSQVARDPASGVASGQSQLIFVTVDPGRDSPERMRSYLGHFDPRIQGLTGEAQALAAWKTAFGAAAAGSGTQIDHSTSLFALDPQGRPVGVLLRPSDAKGIIKDLEQLKGPGLAAAASAEPSGAHGSHPPSGHP